jgi:hypothetical protein
MMDNRKKPAELPVDKWVWGNERLIWGYAPEHAYTFKVLEPKKGREGCLSLQYHDQKSESWLVLRGVAWALVIVDGKVCTRVMRERDIQNLEPPMIHRLMGLSDDVQVLEPSTPDRHAADKTAPKDVIRLHCVLGREVAAPKDPEEARLIKLAVEYTEEAIRCCEEGKLPPEHNAEYLKGRGSFTLSGT